MDSDTVALGDSSLGSPILLCCMKFMFPGKQADTRHSASRENCYPKVAVHQWSQTYRRAGLLSKLLSNSRQMENILNSGEMAPRKLEDILQLVMAAFGPIPSNKDHRNPQPVLACASQQQRSLSLGFLQHWKTQPGASPLTPKLAAIAAYLVFTVIRFPKWPPSESPSKT